MGRKNTDKQVRAREELVLRLRNQRVPWQLVKEAANCSLSQAQKDFRNALERRREETAEGDDWLLEQEARNEEVARTAWDMIGRLKKATRDDPAANTQAVFAIDRFLRTAMAAEDRIAELRGIRLGQRKCGEPTSVNLKSAADIVPLLEQGVSDALGIDDPDKRSRALLQAIRAAPEVLEKARIEVQGEEGGAPTHTAGMDIHNADIYWEAARELALTIRADFEVMMDALRRGENVPELRPPGPGEKELLDVLRKKAELKLKARRAGRGNDDPSDQSVGHVV